MSNKPSTTTKVRRRAGVPKPRALSGTGIGDTKPKNRHTITGEQPGEVKRLVGVFFGPPKTGKTTLACSGKNVLLMSFDPQGEYTETLKGRKDITVIRPKDQGEIDDIIKALYTTDAGRFDWVVVDSLSFLFLTLGGKEITSAWKEDRDFRRAYGKAGAGVQQVIHDLVLLEGMNTIFTAHLEKVDTEDENGVPLEQKLGENEVRIAVTPMVWRILGPAVSFQGRTYKETVWEKGVDKKRNKRTRYMVSFNDGERSPAGSRLQMKGEYEIELDTLDKLATELLGG